MCIFSTLAFLLDPRRPENFSEASFQYVPFIQIWASFAMPNMGHLWAAYGLILKTLTMFSFYLGPNEMQTSLNGNIYAF